MFAADASSQTLDFPEHMHSGGARVVFLDERGQFRYGVVADLLVSVRGTTSVPEAGHFFVKQDEFFEQFPREYDVFHCVLCLQAFGKRRGAQVTERARSARLVVGSGARPLCVSPPFRPFRSCSALVVTKYNVPTYLFIYIFTFELR